MYHDAHDICTYIHDDMKNEHLNNFIKAIIAPTKFYILWRLNLKLTLTIAERY